MSALLYHTSNRKGECGAGGVCRVCLRGKLAYATRLEGEGQGGIAQRHSVPSAAWRGVERVKRDMHVELGRVRKRAAKGAPTLTPPPCLCLSSRTYVGDGARAIGMGCACEMRHVRLKSLAVLLLFKCAQSVSLGTDAVCELPHSHSDQRQEPPPGARLLPLPSCPLRQRLSQKAPAVWRGGSLTSRRCRVTKSSPSGAPLWCSSGARASVSLVVVIKTHRAVEGRVDQKTISAKRPNASQPEHRAWQHTNATLACHTRMPHSYEHRRFKPRDTPRESPSDRTCHGRGGAAAWARQQ